MEASCCLVGGVEVWVGNESGQVFVMTLMRIELYCLLLVWRISTKTSFWFKSVGCVGALAWRLWLMYSGGRSVDSNSWSSVLVIFETFDLIRTEN